MWYKNSFRRHLTDMHIADWDKSFMSKFSAETYYELLKTARVKSVMIPLLSLVGLPYFPSKHARMHNGFIGKEDEMKKLFRLCRSNGIDVVAYFSTHFNNWAAENNPDWRILDPNGKDRLTNDPTFRYGLCCDNNLGYRDYVEKQIIEMAELFKDDMDGVFYDQLYFEIPCQCAVCKERYLKEMGKPLPDVANMSNPDWVESIAVRERWLGEFGAFLETTHKKYMPKVTFLMNVGGLCADTDKYNMWCSGELAKQSDYAAGDIHGGVPEKSVACKVFYNMTKNQPFELMASRTEPNLHAHTVTKTETKMLKYAMISAAHHGATFIIDAIDPVGTFDKRLYDCLGRIFEKEERYEKYFTGKLVGDVGVFYNFDAKSSLTNQAFEPHNCTVNACLNLSYHKIPYGVFTSVNFNIEDYKFVILPQLRSLSEENKKRLIKYLENGGYAYISGCDQPDITEVYANVKKVGMTEYKITYIYPTEKYSAVFEDYNKEYPLPFSYTLPVCVSEKSEVIAKYVFPFTKKTDATFTSIHANPPGIVTDIPAITFTKMGKGGLIWSAVPLEYDTVIDYKKSFINLIFSFVDRKDISIIAETLDSYELVMFKDGKDSYISVVNIADKDPDLHMPVRNYEIKVKTAKPKKILLLPDETELPFSYENGYATFTLRDFTLFDMYKLVV